MAVREPQTSPLQLRVFPQPSDEHLTLEMQLPFDGRVRARVLSLSGQELAVFEWENAVSGTLRVPVELPAAVQAGPWTGFLEVRLSNRDKSTGQIIPLLGN